MGDGYGKLFLLFLAIAVIFLGASSKGYQIMSILFAKSGTATPPPSTTPTTPGQSSGGSNWGKVPASNPTDLSNITA